MLCSYGFVTCSTMFLFICTKICLLPTVNVEHQLTRKHSVDVNLSANTDHIMHLLIRSCHRLPTVDSSPSGRLILQYLWLVFMPLPAISCWMHSVLWRSTGSMHLWVIIYEKFVNTMSYKPFVWSAPDLHLRCSWGQRWTDFWGQKVEC